MLTLIAGEQGAGKTALAVRRAFRMLDKRPAAQLYANLEIDHPRAHYASLEEMSAPDFPKGVCIWDEAPRLLESRRSQSLPMSRLQSTTEERKHGRDIIMTAQMPGQIDVRVRFMCKSVTVLRPLFITKRHYDPDTDDITRREHPRLIVASTWKGMHADKLKPDTRLSRQFIFWAQLARYVDRYDTTASIDVAAHLRGKDFYLDKQPALRLAETDGDDAQESGPVVRSRVPARTDRGRQPAQPPREPGSPRVRGTRRAVARPPADG
ncbi:MAG: Zonular occludens toxin (Zot) [Frankiales bacterium]|nr:Zonular occludens toxin (Zot) [Frankiales bacterium]